MNIIGVQLILIFFAFFMIYVSYLHWKKKEISNMLFTFWLCIWFIFIFFTLRPKLLEPLIKDLFIIRVMDLGMIGAFMFLTFLTIENNIKIRNIEKKLEDIIRKIALRN